MDPFEVPITLTWETADCIDRFINDFGTDDINVIVNFCIIFARQSFDRVPGRYKNKIYNDIKKAIHQNGTTTTVP